MNVENLRHCIEQSPKLRYDFKMTTNSCMNGAADSYVVEGKFLVDYEKKTATAITKKTVRGGAMESEKAVYRDLAVVKTTVDNLLDGMEGSQAVKETMSAEEYDELFSAHGALRPIQFDVLRPAGEDKRLPNSMAFIMEIPEQNDLEEWEITSRAVISLYSEETLHMTTLSSQISQNNPHNMSVIVNEMTVHMCE